LSVTSIFTEHFVVPIMYLSGDTCVNAWRIFLAVLKPDAVHFVIYLLFLIVLVIDTFVLVAGFILCTCCVGAVLLFIPFIDAVILLPITIFWRAYSLYYLAQYGPEFDVFRAGEVQR
jgi:hypothetical protein